MRKGIRFCVLLCLLCLTVSLMICSASASYTSGSCGEGLTWRHDSNTGELVISGSGEMDNYDKMRNFAPWCNYTIKSVYISSGVTSIGDYAFYDLDELTSVTIRNDVVSIGKGAFSDCNALTDVIMGTGVKSIGSSAFFYCDALVDVTLGAGVESIGSAAFYRCVALERITFNDGLKSIENSAFYDCDALKSVTIPDTVTSIEKSAFQSCSAMTTAHLGEGIEIISENAFGDCYELTDVTFGSNLRTIESYAFEYCAIESVTLGDCLESIGVGAFYGCSSMKSVDLGESVKTINANAFYNCVSLTSITIPNSLETVNTNAFYFCSGLTAVYISDLERWCEISFAGAMDNPCYYAKKLYLNGKLIQDLVLPDEVTSISAYAFYNCDSLTSVTIHDAVTNIGTSAFGSTDSLTAVHISDLIKWNAINFENTTANPCYYAEKLYLNGTLITELAIPKEVTHIGAYAFCGCSSMTTVNIHNNVTSIGNGAFYNCKGFSDVIIPDSVTSIGAYAFSGCEGLVDLPVPDSVTSIEDYTFQGCTGLTNVTIPYSVTSIGAHAFKNCTGITDMTISDSVTSIGASAFSGCTKLTQLPIPDSVTKIEDYTFQRCTGLTNVTIPGNITSIGSYAFNGCTKLTSVKILDGVTSVGSSAFSGCTRLADLTIPDSVTRIGMHAFNTCSALTSVVLPKGITNINSYAFMNCASLERIAVSNPQCVIGNNTNTLGVSTKTVIYGASGSTAATYAKSFKFKFIAICACDAPDYIEIDTVLTCTQDGRVGYQCENCNETYMIEEVLAYGHDYVVTVFEPSEEAFGYTQYACSNCGDTYCDSYTGIDDSLKFKQASVTLSSDFSINFYVRDSVLQGFSEPAVVFKKAIYDNNGNIVSYETITVSEFTKATLTDGTVCHVFQFTGVTSAELGSAVSATLYATKDDVRYTGATVDYSVLKYATNMLKKTSDDKLKTLLVDLLNYGAQSQLYFGYNTANLVTDALTAEQKAFATTQTPRLTTCRDMISNDEATVSFKTCTLVLENKVTINYYLNLNNYQSEVNDLYAVATYTDYEGKEWNIRIDSEEFDYKEYDGVNYYVVNFSKLNAMQMRTQCTLELFSKTTNERVSNTVIYSIESYAYSMQESGDAALIALLDMMMKYGDSVQVYFAE